MKPLITAAFTALLAACSSTSENVGNVFDRLEFKDGQEGCIRAQGQLNVGNNPFASSTVNVNLVKKQGDNPPDC
jgi:hypothetical protein